MTATLTKPEPVNEIVVETINGKDYFHRENDFHDLIFWDYTATKFYSHLYPNPLQEDWEHDEVEKNGETTCRDIETIMVPILLDDNGDELEVEQIAELYDIKLNHIAGNSRFIDGDEKECYHWVGGERDDEPFSSH